MEIVLRKDTPVLGKIGNVVKVADGYARNYLIPHGTALEATPKNLKVVQEEIKRWEKQAEKWKASAVNLAHDIEKLSLSFSRKCGEENKLFGAVTSIDIEEGIKKNGLQIDRKMIHLEEPIKTLGTFTIPIKLHSEVIANLKVSVVKE